MRKNLIDSLRLRDPSFDLVVYTAAISSENEELVASKNLNILTIDRAESSAPLCENMIAPLPYLALW